MFTCVKMKNCRIQVKQIPICKDNSFRGSPAHQTTKDIGEEETRMVVSSIHLCSATELKNQNTDNTRNLFLILSICLCLSLGLIPSHSAVSLSLCSPSLSFRPHVCFISLSYLSHSPSSQLSFRL